jgi:hypothetical protein
MRPPASRNLPIMQRKSIVSFLVTEHKNFAATGLKWGNSRVGLLRIIVCVNFQLFPQVV